MNEKLRQYLDKRRSNGVRLAKLVSQLRTSETPTAPPILDVTINSLLRRKAATGEFGAPTPIHGIFLGHDEKDMKIVPKETAGLIFHNGWVANLLNFLTNYRNIL